MISLALFEPDIPQNTGTILRMCDCLGVHLDIIEPCGFIFGGQHMRRATMDYINTADYTLHDDFTAFLNYIQKNNKRIILSTTKSSVNYLDFVFMQGDVILMGKESKGVPEYVHKLSDSKIKIQMLNSKRSLNLAVSSAIIIGEAIRQIRCKL